MSGGIPTRILLSTGANGWRALPCDFREAAPMLRRVLLASAGRAGFRAATGGARLATAAAGLVAGRWALPDWLYADTWPAELAPDPGPDASATWPYGEAELIAWGLRCAGVSVVLAPVRPDPRPLPPNRPEDAP